MRTGADVSALASLQVDSLLSYAVAIVFPALDAVLPVLPSETIVIALGVSVFGFGLSPRAWDGSAAASSSRGCS